MTPQEMTDMIQGFIPFCKYIDMRVVRLDRDGACFMIPFKSELIGDQRRQALHGGVISTLIDTVGGLLALAQLDDFMNDAVSTVDLRVDYLQPGQAKDLYAEAEVIRRGNRLIVTKMIAYHDDREQLVADGRGVYSIYYHLKGEASTE